MPAIHLNLALFRDLALEILSPSTCASCEGRAPFRTLFCQACAITIERVTAPRARAAFHYGGAIKQAIVRLKFEQRPDLARGLGSCLIPLVLEPFDAIVPVPLHPYRLAERGYNQASILADPLSHATGVPIDTSILHRVRNTVRQTDLQRAERRANVAAAFRARRAAHGKRVLLVDDVRTTGATLEACEAALRTAGITVVDSLTIASTPA
jgi:ComF family protein